jgi:hypothetical protein
LAEASAEQTVVYSAVGSVATKAVAMAALLAELKAVRLVATMAAAMAAPLAE